MASCGNFLGITSRNGTTMPSMFPDIEDRPRQKSIMKKRQAHKYKYFRHCIKYRKCVENPRQAFFFYGHAKHYLTQNSKNFCHYLG